MDTIFEFFAFCFFGVLLVFFSIFGIGAIFYYAGAKPACEQYAKLSRAEISTQFFGSSCLIKYEGRWVDYDVAVRNKQEVKVSE